MLNVNKMIITAFREIEANIEEGKPKRAKPILKIPPYIAHVNPESYTIDDKICYSAVKVPGRTRNLSAFNTIKPSTLSFEFWFDATGALGADTINQTMGVTGRISRFLEVVRDPYEDKDSGAKPNLLLLTWGQLAFFCKLTSLTIDYKKFNPLGIPIQAKANATFKREEIELFGNTLKEKTLTIQEIKKAETLGFVSRTAYGVTDQLVRIAKANKLKSLKNIKPGKKLILPPL